MQSAGVAYPRSVIWQFACALLLVLCIAPVRAENTNDNIDIGSLTEAQKGEIWDQAIHILGGNANVVSRWSGPVRFSLIESSQNASTSHAAAVVREIAELTLLPLTIISSGHASIVSYLAALDGSTPYQLLPCEQLNACANFVVVVSDIASMRKIARAIPLRDVYQKSLASDTATVCFFSPFQSASVIRQAFVFVRDDLPADMINTCLQEEIYQSFGLFSDYTDSEYFSFNNRVQPKSITLYDRALLQAMYEFPPGTPAFLVAKRLISNLEAKF